MRKIVFVTTVAVSLLLNLHAVRLSGAEQPGSETLAGFSANAVLSPEELDAQTGGERGRLLVTSNMNLDGILTDNIVLSSINGYNMLRDGAFSNASGFATIIQNSGNNVLIQNTTIVNFTTEQP